MRKLSTLFLVLAMSASFSFAAQTTEPPKKEKLTQEEKALQKEEKAELKKAEKRAEQDAKREARLAKAPTFEEFLTTYVPFQAVGFESVDLFCSQAHSMLMDYKEINDSLNFIKIEIVPIPDAGDGVTSEVKITDGNGNPRTKQDTNKKWADISTKFAVFGVDCALLVTAGAATILDVMTAENVPSGAGVQVRNSIKALKMLTIEIDRTTPKLRSQREMLKSVDEN